MHLIRRVCLKSVIAALLFSVAPCLEASDPDPLIEDAESRAVFDRFAERNRKTDRRHERALATYHFDTDLRNYRRMSGQTTRVWEYRFESPDRLWLNLESIEVICDGERLWAAQYFYEQYALQEAPERSDLLETIETILGDDRSMLPLTLTMLLSSDADQPFSLMGGEIVITGHAEDLREGVACVRLGFVSENVPNPPSDDPVSMAGSMWFSKETGMINAIELDMRDAMQAFISSISDDKEALEMMGITEDDDIDNLFRSATFLIEIESLPAHQIDSGTLQIPDPDEMELVESFGSIDFLPDADEDALAAGDLMPKDFLGEPSPRVQGRDQHGELFDSSEHMGEVLVLVVGPSFRPGIAAPWLREAERVQGAFREKPVRVLGLINAIDDFFEEDEIDTTEYQIPIIRDVDERLIDSFRVSVSPVMFLIDQEGIVQAVLESRSKIRADLLDEDIASLLGGDDLIDDAALDSRREELRQARAVREERSPTLVLEEIGIDRVRTKKIHRWGRNDRSPVESNLGICDVNDDGVSDIITSNGSAQLVVIDGSDLSIRTINLESVEREDVSVVACDRIRTSRGAGWAIVTSRYSPFGSQTTETVGVFLDDGSKVRRWTLKPRNEETIYTHGMDRLFDVGDLDGDGVDEIAVGVSMSADHAGSEDVLVVFDSEGEVLFSKDVQYGFDDVRIVPAAGGKPGWVTTSNFTGVQRYDLAQ